MNRTHTLLQTAASFGPCTSKREQSTALCLRLTASFDLSKVRLITGSGVMFLEQMPHCRRRAREHAICFPGREVFQHKKQHEYMLTKTTITTSRHTALQTPSTPSMCLHCPPLALHAQQIPRTAHRFFMLPLGWLALRLDKTAITTAIVTS